MAEKIPLFDIHEASFLDMNDVPVTFTLQGTRVIFEVPQDQHTYLLIREYHENPQVSILDYVRSLRKLRAKMLDKREGKEMNGNGGHHGNHKL